MRKIAVVTGTRAEYGILYSVLRAIEARTDLELSLVVTGMHLSHEFGYTVQEIEQNFTIDAKVDMLLSSDTPVAMAKSIGLGIIGMTQAYEWLKPSMILVLGDRVEALAGTIAGTYAGIPVAHIHGGDSLRAGFDEYTRHAITKLAHIHLPTTEKSAERIIKMGEDEWRVYTVGSPALDVILNEALLPAEVLVERFGVNLTQPLILVVQHSVSTQASDAPSQMRETLEAIIEIGNPAILIYPNSDAGGRRMIEVIKEYGKHPFIKTFKSLPRKEYLSLMKVASAMVGNSSSGIIDAPSLGLPVVNIGIREEDRERGKNVIDVGHSKQEIVKAIEKALADTEFLKEVKKCKSPYGDGKAGQRIAEILSKVEITPRLFQKKIAY